MGYTIGSEKGKQIAQNMKAGETYKCSDGSTWKKNSDGSVSVTTKSGSTYNNAYTPTSSSSTSSSGGKTTTSSSTSSSGSKTTSSGTSGGNSQYSGYQYTIGSDKGKEIAQNLGVGNTYQASDGSVWLKNSDGSVSVNYKGNTYQNAYVPPTTSTPTTTSTPSGNQYVGTGTYNDADLPADKKAQIEVYKNIYDNAMASGDIATANAAHDMAESIRKEYGYSGGGDGSEYIPFEQEETTPQFNYDVVQPSYSGSKYDPKIEELLNQILNRDDFSYNVKNDPLYQQYAQMYQREGDRAMRETMAEAAASAGGMNTYAITAAQQANNYYNSQLNDRIPELYQLAYDMYLADKESKVQDLGILQDLDATQYNRYRDTMSDWKDDRNFVYGMYRDNVSDSQWDKSFDRNNYVTDRNFISNNYWTGKEWNSQESDSAKNEVWKYIEMGVIPSAELISKAGMSETDVRLAVEAVRAEQTKATGNNTDTSYSGYTGIDDNENNSKYTPVETDSKWIGGFYDLGLPMVINDAPDLLVELEEAGAIYEEDGKLKWSFGWNKNNYQDKLNSRFSFNLPGFN